MRRSFLLPLLAFPGLVFAQVGTNSSCATAIALAVSPTNVQQSLIPVDGRWFTTAVPDPVTTCSGSTEGTSAWYSFTATATQQWIRTEGQGTGDESMEVFSGTCGSLTSIGCFPPNSATPALTGLTVGSTYYLRVVMGTNSFCEGNDFYYCQVWIGVVSAPAHNECSGAIELPVTSGAVQAWPATEISSLGATQSQAACSGDAAASNDDVWYRFTATGPAHMLVTTGLNGGIQDNVFQWFSGTCGNLTNIGCDVDFQTGLTPGTQYYIRAYSQSTDAAVTVRAVADVFAPAPNDECSGALAIEVTLGGEAPKPVSISTIHCTGSTVPCGTQAHDVWLSFTAPGTSVFAVTEGSGHAALYSGSCGSLVCVSQGSTDPELEFTGLTPGATYYLKIGTNVFQRKNTKAWVFVPIGNDDCATAIDLAVQSDPVEFTNGHLLHSSAYTWYRFTATAPRLLVEGYTTAGDWTTRAYVFSGACGGQTQVAASNDISTPLVLDGLVVGQQYYVRMEAINPIAFRVAVREVVPNDACDGAIELPFSTPAQYASVQRVDNALAADGTAGCLPARDLLYRFIATHNSAGLVIIGGVGTIEHYSGACGALTSLGCASNTAKASFTGLTPGAEYHIRVSSSPLPMRFTPMLFDQPANDEVSGAVSALFGSTFAQPLEQFWTYGASQSMPVHCPGWSPDDDTWFTFTATATGHDVIAQQRNNFFMEASFTYGFWVEVYDTLSSDDAVLDANVISCGFSPRALTGLTIGKQYLYRVFQAEFGPAYTCGFITCITDSNNDEANGAMTLTYTDTYGAAFNTAGATQSLPGADCRVDDTADDDIWFKFTATSTVGRIVVGDGTANVTIELFSGTLGNLTSIACDGNILDLPSLTAGETYYARVYSWNNATPVEGRIGLIATPSLTANGCVDENCLGPVLVPNPGIESGEHCWVHISEIGATAGFGTQLAPGWPRMQWGSSDGFNSCASYNANGENPGFTLSSSAQRILSRSGKGMAGIYASGPGQLFEYTEYVQAPLSAPLVPGEPYLVSFHVATSPEHRCVAGLGAALSEGPLANGSYQPLTVQPAVISLDVICSDGWTNICGVVVPNAPVDHITVGIFLREGEASTFGTAGGLSYYFIDDVVVTHIDDPGCITGLGDVPPLDESTSGDGDALRIYPNPAADRVTIMLDGTANGERGVIELFDATGKRVHAEQVNALTALQPFALSSEWKEGLYLLMLRVEGQAPKSARLLLKR